MNSTSRLPKVREAGETQPGPSLQFEACWQTPDMSEECIGVLPTQNVIPRAGNLKSSTTQRANGNFARPPSGESSQTNFGPQSSNSSSGQRGEWGSSGLVG